MRIISKFRDYYDCIQSYGQDPSIVYVRNSEIIKDKSYFNFRFEGVNDDRTHLPFLIESCTIGFCGKIHPVLKVKNSITESKWHFCFNLQEYDNYVIKNIPNDRLKEYHSTKESYWRKGDWFFGRQKRMFAEKFFTAGGTSSKKLEEIFFEHKSPIMVDTHTTSRKTFVPTDGGWREGNHYVEINPCLKKFEFYRIMDPHMAYQELSGYVGGVLGMTARNGKASYKGEPMSMTVSDKDLASAKGYDKWSFRKEPQPKPKRKRKNK